MPETISPRPSPAPASLPLQPSYQQLPGRLILKLRPDVVAAMDDGSNGLRFDRPTGLPNAAVYSITDGKSVQEKMEEMNSHPGGFLVAGMSRHGAA